MNRLKEKYKKEIEPEMLKEFKLGNVMEVPRILKVSINSGIGPFMENKEAVKSFADELSDIAGQRVYERKARKSEAGFKIKQNDVVGFAVTLRSDRMWSFLDKMVNVAFPRIRDFRGFNPDSFDENGNYSIGIKEHVIFPEVNPNITKGIRSLQVTIVFNGKNIEQNRFLLKKLNFPFADSLPEESK